MATATEQIEMPTDLVLRKEQDGIAVLTLNRPASRNPLSLAMMSELQANLDEIKENTQIKV